MPHFADLFKNLTSPPAVAAVSGAPQLNQIPPGVATIADTVDQYIPVLERITGLTRRELFLQLLKTGLRGGNIENILNGLMGKQPEKDAKFVKYVKTLAIWVPVAVFLFGLAVVSVVIFAKVIISVVGGL